MDVNSFSDFVGMAVRFIGTMSDRAKDMDGRLAFMLGLGTWFVVEQMIRRLAGMLRWAILGAALAGGGAAVVSVLGLSFDEPPARPSVLTPGSAQAPASLAPLASPAAAPSYPQPAAAVRP